MNKQTEWQTTQILYGPPFSKLGYEYSRTSMAPTGLGPW